MTAQISNNKPTLLQQSDINASDISNLLIQSLPGQYPWTLYLAALISTVGFAKYVFFLFGAKLASLTSINADCYENAMSISSIFLLLMYVFNLYLAVKQRRKALSNTICIKWMTIFSSIAMVIDTINGNGITSNSAGWMNMVLFLYHMMLIYAYFVPHDWHCSHCCEICMIVDRYIDFFGGKWNRFGPILKTKKVYPVSNLAQDLDTMKNILFPTNELFEDIMCMPDDIELAQLLCLMRFLSYGPVAATFKSNSKLLKEQKKISFAIFNKQSPLNK